MLKCFFVIPVNRRCSIPELLVILYLVKYIKLVFYLELQIMEKQKELLEAKTESLQSAKRMEELYSDAIKAFTSYGSSALFRTENENVQ